VIPNVYELEQKGISPKDFLQRFPSQTQKSIVATWEWRARPGQRWVPGPERITDHQAGRGWGKALALETPLPTPTGWTTMGEVQVGDQLLDEQGRPCKVTGTFEVDAQEAWRLQFSDGTWIDACGDHLWVTLTALERKRLNRKFSPIPTDWASKDPIQTRELVRTAATGKRGDRNHCIPVTKPLELPKRRLVLDPYLLGVWLGDGSKNRSDITCHEKDAPHYGSACLRAGYDWVEKRRQEINPEVGFWNIGDSPSILTSKGTVSTNPFFLGLRKLGVLNNKHIPAVYLRSSAPQRLALLQGLMDTDGFVSPESGHAEFCNTNPHLAHGVLELARSLGQKPVIAEGRAMLKGVDYGPKWRVTWRPTIQVATLPRKLAEIRANGAQGMRNEHRMVVGTEPLHPQPMRCVTVDSPNSMYLAGAGMIPTHNTANGAEAICDAALDPERWGGSALAAGVNPQQVKRDCLTGPAGIFVAAERRAKAGVGPAIIHANWNDRFLRFEAPKGGGGGGLVLRWAASSDPKSFRGIEIGLAWLDEFGVWYHQLFDEQGSNAFQALEPGAMRAGPDPKILITQTPSRAIEVRELQRDAERPECPPCKAEALAQIPDGRWRGEPGQEPWRLPPSPRKLAHPLLFTRSTEPVRTCPICKTTVIARVRLVTGSSLDNPFLAASMRAEAKRALAGNTPAARAEFDPQGESDSIPTGTLIDTDPKVLTRVHLNVDALDADRWQTTLNSLGSERSLVFVDPAVTSGDNSDDTGMVVSCLRQVRGPEGILYDQVVALQDGTVRPADVQGAPSATWAPKAVWLAMCWGASKICVEVNQGGDEVLASLKGQLGKIPSEEEILERIAKEMGRPPVVRGQPTLMPAARRMRQTGLTLQIEAVHRRSGKPARWGWYGESASRKEQALLCLEWLDGERHWIPALAQASAYEPERKGKEKRDRFDAVIGASQVLLGVRESKQGISKAENQNWMIQGVDRLFGR